MLIIAFDKASVKYFVSSVSFGISLVYHSTESSLGQHGTEGGGCRMCWRTCGKPITASRIKFSALSSLNRNLNSNTVV